MTSRPIGLPVLVYIFAGILHAQTPAPTDPLGRGTPQSMVLQFLEACHSRDYSKAQHFLDMRNMSSTDRSKYGTQLAVQLEDLLDDTNFEVATMSRDPEGDQFDNLPPNIEHLATFKVNGQNVELQLERQEINPALRVWMVTPASVALISTAHKVLAETPFEKLLPQQLVTFEILDTPVWRWIALILIAGVFWVLASAIAWAFVKAGRRFAGLPHFEGPLRLFLATTGFRIALEFVPPSSLPRLFLERTSGLAITISVVWAVAVAIDTLAKRWHAGLDPRVQAVSYSVLPLGIQVLKLSLYLIALLSVVKAWGYPISTVLAGLGVGGIAVALAAQKTIENLFGGVSVIGDRPVLVGDVCRFGTQTGTVVRIGLRSTRLRTPDRTIISVPNAQFSSMELENFSARDKIWFHPMLNLRKDTTSEQLAKVLASCRDVLAKQPKVEAGKLPVRFVGLGAYSLDVEVNVYIATADADEFLGIQQELLLQLLQAVERAGTSLALPWAQDRVPIPDQ